MWWREINRGVVCVCMCVCALYPPSLTTDSKKMRWATLFPLPVAVLTVVLAYAVGWSRVPPYVLSHVIAAGPARVVGTVGVLLYDVAWIAIAWGEPDLVSMALTLIATTALMVSVVVTNDLFHWGHDAIGGVGVFASLLFMIATFRHDAGRVYLLRTLCACIYSAGIAVAGGLYFGDQSEGAIAFTIVEIILWGVHALFLTTWPWRLARVF